jgi:hypothetical protein
MEGSKLGGQWKVPSLVANGRFQVCLVANGRFQVWWPMEGERKTPFHLFPLSPQQTLLKPSIFSFDLTVLFYHDFRLSLTPFFSFSPIYKL